MALWSLESHQRGGAALNEIGGWGRESAVSGSHLHCFVLPSFQWLDLCSGGAKDQHSCGCAYAIGGPILHWHRCAGNCDA